MTVWRKRVAWVAELALLGGIGAGCAGEHAKAAPAPVASAVPAAPREHAHVPGGWRDLKFGMSEADVKKVVLEYRKDVTAKWERSETTFLPIVRLDASQCDDVLSDEKRFQHWSIQDLDDGAELVQTWHDRGSLVAIQMKGKASPEAFLRKASEAYGAQPERAKFQFSDERTHTHEVRDVAVWRGDDVSAFVWISGSSPTLLLWANADMRDRAAEHQTVLDAPARAASSEANAREKATKF